MSKLVKRRKTRQEIKRKIMNTYILPVVTYGAETWSTSDLQMEKIAIAQRKMERQMLGITVTLLDRKTNEWIRDKTRVEDVSQRIRLSKLRWAGHVARLNDNRWTARSTAWQPRLFTRKRGRPRIRWRDDIVSNFGPAWHRVAQDRKVWKSFGEGLLGPVNPP